MDSAIIKILNYLLDKYIEPMGQQQLDVSLWQGLTHISNLKIKSTAFVEHNIPLKIIEGSIQSLDVTLPWSRLKTDPTIISASGIFIKCEICGDVLINSDLKHVQNSLKELKKTCAEKETSQNSVLLGLSQQILNNLQLNINDIQISLIIDNGLTAGLLINNLLRESDFWRIKNFSLFFDYSQQPDISISPSNNEYFKRAIQHDFILKDFSFEIDQKTNTINTSKIILTISKEQIYMLALIHKQYLHFNLKRKYVVCGHPNRLPRSPRSSGLWWRYAYNCTVEKRFPHRFDPKTAFIMLKKRHQYEALFNSNSTQLEQFEADLDLNLILQLRTYSIQMRKIEALNVSQVELKSLETINDDPSNEHSTVLDKNWNQNLCLNVNNFSMLFTNKIPLFTISSTHFKVKFKRKNIDYDMSMIIEEFSAHGEKIDQVVYQSPKMFFNCKYNEHINRRFEELTIENPLINFDLELYEQVKQLLPPIEIGFNIDFSFNNDENLSEREIEELIQNHIPNNFSLNISNLILNYQKHKFEIENIQGNSISFDPKGNSKTEDYSFSISNFSSSFLIPFSLSFIYSRSFVPKYPSSYQISVPSITLLSIPELNFNSSKLVGNNINIIDILHEVISSLSYVPSYVHFHIQSIKFNQLFFNHFDLLTKKNEINISLQSIPLVAEQFELNIVLPNSDANKINEMTITKLSFLITHELFEQKSLLNIDSISVSNNGKITVNNFYIQNLETQPTAYILSPIFPELLIEQKKIFMKLNNDITNLNINFTQNVLSVVEMMLTSDLNPIKKVKNSFTETNQLLKIPFDVQINLGDIQVLVGSVNIKIFRLSIIIENNITYLEINSFELRNHEELLIQIHDNDEFPFKIKIQDRKAFAKLGFSSYFNFTPDFIFLVLHLILTSISYDSINFEVFNVHAHLLYYDAKIVHINLFENKIKIEQFELFSDNPNQCVLAFQNPLTVDYSKQIIDIYLQSLIINYRDSYFSFLSSPDFINFSESLKKIIKSYFKSDSDEKFLLSEMLTRLNIIIEETNFTLSDQFSVVINMITMKEGLFCIKKVSNSILSIEDFKSNKFQTFEIQKISFDHSDFEKISQFVQAIPHLSIPSELVPSFSHPAITDFYISSFILQFSKSLTLELMNCDYFDQQFTVEMFQISQLAKKLSKGPIFKLDFRDNKIKLSLSNFSVIFDPMIFSYVFLIIESPLLSLFSDPEKSIDETSQNSSINSQSSSINSQSSSINSQSSSINSQSSSINSQNSSILSLSNITFNENRNKRIEFEFNNLYLGVVADSDKGIPFFLISFNFNGFIYNSDWEMKVFQLSASFAENKFSRPYLSILSNFSFSLSCHCNVITISFSDINLNISKADLFSFYLLWQKIYEILQEPFRVMKHMTFRSSFYQNIQYFEHSESNSKLIYQLKVGKILLFLCEDNRNFNPSLPFLQVLIPSFSFGTKNDFLHIVLNQIRIEYYNLNTMKWNLLLEPFSVDLNYQGQNKNNSKIDILVNSQICINISHYFLKKVFHITTELLNQIEKKDFHYKTDDNFVLKNFSCKPISIKILSSNEEFIIDQAQEKLIKTDYFSKNILFDEQFNIIPSKIEHPINLQDNLIVSTYISKTKQFLQISSYIQIKNESSTQFSIAIDNFSPISLLPNSTIGVAFGYHLKINDTLLMVSQLYQNFVYSQTVNENFGTPQIITIENNSFNIVGHFNKKKGVFKIYITPLFSFKNNLPIPIKINNTTIGSGGILPQYSTPLFYFEILGQHSLGLSLFDTFQNLKQFNNVLPICLDIINLALQFELDPKKRIYASIFSPVIIYNETGITLQIQDPISTRFIPFDSITNSLLFGNPSFFAKKPTLPFALSGDQTTIKTTSLQIDALSISNEDVKLRSSEYPLYFTPFKKATKMAKNRIPSRIITIYPAIQIENDLEFTIYLDPIISVSESPYAEYGYSKPPSMILEPHECKSILYASEKFRFNISAPENSLTEQKSLIEVSFEESGRTTFMLNGIDIDLIILQSSLGLKAFLQKALIPSAIMLCNYTEFPAYLSNSLTIIPFSTSVIHIDNAINPQISIQIADETLAVHLCSKYTEFSSSKSSFKATIITQINGNRLIFLAPNLECNEIFVNDPLSWFEDGIKISVNVNSIAISLIDEDDREFALLTLANIKSELNKLSKEAIDLNLSLGEIELDDMADTETPVALWTSRPFLTSSIQLRENGLFNQFVIESRNAFINANISFINEFFAFIKDVYIPSSSNLKFAPSKPDYVRTYLYRFNYLYVQPPSLKISVLKQTKRLSHHALSPILSRFIPELRGVLIDFLPTQKNHVILPLKSIVSLSNLKMRLPRILNGAESTMRTAVSALHSVSQPKSGGVLGRALGFVANGTAKVLNVGADAIRKAAADEEKRFRARDQRAIVFNQIGPFNHQLANIQKSLSRRKNGESLRGFFLTSSGSYICITDTYIAEIIQNDSLHILFMVRMNKLRDIKLKDLEISFTKKFQKSFKFSLQNPIHANYVYQHLIFESLIPSF